MKRKIIPYNPKLKAFARKLRNESTRSEVTLWIQIKSKVISKYGFLRQKPLGNYIVDFYCYELNLVMELDGLTHSWERIKEKDYDKELYLNGLGLNVLRFADSAILSNMDFVLDYIFKYIKCYEINDFTYFNRDDLIKNPLNKLTRLKTENRNVPFYWDDSGRTPP
ncbi:MAG: DNA methylase [Ignavibacteriae bacterium HGW-Ignavibacteriae-4]|jgi:very-short-patch-repair endonuclease|nr:MAG: DNA methylase [Ignavibacteriae bacterium HGW-Ignavibacteriae-4]